jgi:hypothetical protein
VLLAQDLLQLVLGGLVLEGLSPQRTELAPQLLVLLDGAAKKSPTGRTASERTRWIGERASRAPLRIEVIPLLAWPR